MLKKINPALIGALIFLITQTSLAATAKDLRTIEVLILKDAYQQAEGLCHELLSGYQKNQTEARTYYLLGVCLLKEEKFAQARQNFHKILQSYPRSPDCDDACLGIADSYFLANDLNEAHQKYQQFIRDFSHSDLVSIAIERIQQCRQTKASAGSYFTVQVGCFSNKQNAQELRDQLINSGFSAYLLELTYDKLYHVRAGKFDNRHDAELLEQELKSAGYATKICP